MISTKSDARVESIDVYDREDIPVDELDWAIVEDIARAYEGEFYLPLTDEEQTYWTEEKDDWFPSTRSTAARNSLDFWIKQPGIDGDGLRGGFEAQCHQNPVELQEGDEVFRILMYQEQDLLNKSEVEQEAEEILGNNYEENPTTPRGLLKIPIERRLTLQNAETSLEELEQDKDRFIDYEAVGDKNNRFQLLETVPISMPDDIFGNIRSTTKKIAPHLNSTAVDPEYEGRIVVEVIQPLPHIDYSQQTDEDQYLEMKLYQATGENL